MRRSQAPSILQKRGKCLLPEKKADVPRLPIAKQLDSSTEDSRNTNGKDQSLPAASKERIFNVIWRFVSTKKHKTWKGDGSLIVKPFTQFAILKDENGKVLAEGVINNIQELKVESEIILEDKEFEILEEINYEDCLKDNQSTTTKNIAITTKKIRTEQENLDNKRLETIVDTDLSISIHHPLPVPADDTTSNCDDTILCIRSSELQCYLFDKVLDYYEEREQQQQQQQTELMEPNQHQSKITIRNIIEVMKKICTHPGLLNNEHLESGSNELIQILVKELPDSQEMGPFDSSKLDFVQQFLQHHQQQSVQRQQKEGGGVIVIVILMENDNSINILQALCEYMNIPTYLMHAFNESNPNPDQSRIFVGLWKLLPTTKDESLLQSIVDKLPGISLEIIIFEEVQLIREKFGKILSNLKTDAMSSLRIKGLVTAFTIEELFLWQSEENLDESGFLEKLIKTWRNRNMYSEMTEDWQRIEQNYEKNNDRMDSMDKNRNVFWPPNSIEEDMIVAVYSPKES